VATDLEEILLLISDSLVNIEANQKQFNEYIEVLTDANHSLKTVHEYLIPIIQKSYEVLSLMPDLITDTNLLNEEIKLYLSNNEKRWIENDHRWAKIKQKLGEIDEDE